MTEIIDNTKSYEEQRARLGRMSLKERRLLIILNRNILEDEVLRDLNGNSNTPLENYLEENLYIPKSSKNYTTL